MAFHGRVAVAHPVADIAREQVVEQGRHAHARHGTGALGAWRDQLAVVLDLGIAEIGLGIGQLGQGRATLGYQVVVVDGDQQAVLLEEIALGSRDVLHPAGNLRAQRDFLEGDDGAADLDLVGHLGSFHRHQLPGPCRGREQRQRTGQDEWRDSGKVSNHCFSTICRGTRQSPIIFRDCKPASTSLRPRMKSNAVY